MADYFGYEKETYGPGNVVSSSMVLAKIGNDAPRLVQSCDVQYQRQVNPVFELGSDSVWMSAGQSSGSVTMQRAVGQQKMLVPYRPGSACSTQDITISRGRGACGMDPGIITAYKSLLTSVGVSATASGLTVTDNAQWSTGMVVMS